MHQGGGGNQIDERRLVEAARTDADAFAQLYELYLNRIYAFALRRSTTRHVAEDITASTFERAYRTIHRFEFREGATFRAWLFRIATNEVADHYRKAGRAKTDRGQAALGQLHVAHAEDDLAGVELDDGEIKLMLAALETLKTEYQEVISLRYLSGLTPEEAAAELRIAKPVLNVRLTRALKALRREMDRMGGGTS